MKSAEDIVRALADADPSQHDKETCPYRMAREWVEQQSQGNTPA